LQIVEKSSHLNGYEFLMYHKKNLWEDICKAIKDVDLEYRKKYEDIEVLSPEDGSQKSFKYGSQTMEYKIDIELRESDLIFRRFISIPRGIIQLGDYGEFRDFINDLRNPANEVIFYKKQ